MKKAQYVQVGWNQPITWQYFYKMMRGKNRHRTQCLFPDADLDDLKGSYQNYRKERYQMITLPREFSYIIDKEKHWVIPFVNKASKDEKIAKLLLFKLVDRINKVSKQSSNKRFDTYPFLKKTGKEYSIVPGTYYLKVNGVGHLPKTKVKFEVTEDDIKQTRHYQQAFVMLPHYLREHIYVEPQQKEKTIRDIFEG